MATSEISKDVSLADKKDVGIPLNGQLLSEEKTCREKLLDLKDTFFLCASRTLKHSRSSPKGGRSVDATSEVRSPVNENNISSVEASGGNSERGAASNSDDGSSSDKKGISWRIFRSLDASKIHGFDNELVLLRNLFEPKEDHDKFKAIGIVGVQGVGKSTLCRQLLETLEVKMDYLPRIWISMSTFTDGGDREALVKKILLCLGMESISRDRNLTELLYIIHLQLTGKRYLIVLDDVRRSQDWLTNLNSPSPDRSGSHLTGALPKTGGGRVIVTSRSSAVAKALVGEKNIHQLLPFSDPESFWKIYDQEVKNRGSESGSDDINPEIKQELLEKCRGLPLVAKMLGEVKVGAEAEKKPDGR